MLCISTHYTLYTSSFNRYILLQIILFAIVIVIEVVILPVVIFFFLPRSSSMLFLEPKQDFVILTYHNSIMRWKSETSLEESLYKRTCVGWCTTSACQALLSFDRFDGFNDMGPRRGKISRV